MHKHAFAVAVVTCKHHVIGGAQPQLGHDELELSCRQHVLLQVRERLRASRLAIGVEFAHVALLHLGPLKHLVGLRHPCGHGSRQLRGHSVFSRHDGSPKSLAAVAVVLVQLVGAPPSPRAVSLHTPSCRLGFQALLLALGLLPLALKRLAFQHRLATGLRVISRPHDETTAREQKALNHQSIQQRAIVGDKQPDTRKTRQRLRYQAARRGVQVVRRLVHDQRVGAVPQSAGNLDALLLAARERVVAPKPLVLDGQHAAKLLGLAPPIAGEILQYIRRYRRVLLAVHRKKLRRYRTGIGLQQPAGHGGEGRFATAIIAHNASPPPRERGRHRPHRRIRRAGVRIGDVVEIQLHGSPPSQEAARGRNNSSQVELHESPCVFPRLADDTATRREAENLRNQAERTSKNAKQCSTQRDQGSTV